MKTISFTARQFLALSALSVLGLTACSSSQETTQATQSQPSSAVSTPSASATASTKPKASASASASASVSVSTVTTSPSSSASASASPVATFSSPAASVQAVPTRTPVVQGDTPEPTLEATQAPAANPTPTVSVITVPAPGTNPTSTTQAKATTTVAAANTCGYENIHIAAATAEGAAGSRYITLTFTNAGANPCTLAGWPSVNYVDAAGNTIGAPASQAAEWTSSGETLQPGQSTTATLRETRAGLYGDSCKAVTAAGYKIGIPGTNNSLTLNFPAEACSNAAISQLSVGQVGANS